MTKSIFFPSSFRLCIPEAIVRILFLTSIPFFSFRAFSSTRNLDFLSVISRSTAVVTTLAKIECRWFPLSLGFSFALSSHTLFFLQFTFLKSSSCFLYWEINSTVSFLLHQKPFFLSDSLYTFTWTRRHLYLQFFWEQNSRNENPGIPEWQ